MSDKTSSNKAELALLALQQAVSDKIITLIIEPKLAGKPAESIERFNLLSPGEVAQLGTKDVEYYFRSPQPLDAAKYGEALSRFFNSTKDENGQPIDYYYHLKGDFVGERGGNKPYFNLSGLEFEKFTAGTDPFFVLPDDKQEKDKYGIGIARIDEGESLVIRSAREHRNSLQIDKLNEDSVGLQVHNSPSPYITIVPLPDTLAASIKYAHRLKPVYFNSDGELMVSLRRDDSLFAPRLSAPAHATRQTETQEVLVESPQRPVSHEDIKAALTAYQAKITQVRTGDGSVQCSLIMNTTSEAAKHVSLTSREVADYIANELGFTLIHQSTKRDSLLFPINSEADAEILAARFGIALGEITSFKPRTGGAKRTGNEFSVNKKCGSIYLYLLEEDGVPFLVALADKNKIEPASLLNHFIKNRFGIKPAEDKIELKTEDGSTAYYGKMPISKALFDDLRKDDIPVLPSSEDLMQHIQSLSGRNAEGFRKPEDGVEIVPVTRKRGEKGPAEAAAPDGNYDERLTNILLDAYDSILRSKTSDFYFARVGENEVTHPYAYLIVPPKQANKIKNDVRALGGAAKVLASIGERKSNQRREVIAFPLTEPCFETLQEFDSNQDESSRLNHAMKLQPAQTLTADRAKEWLEKRAKDIVDEIAPDVPLTSALGLTSSLASRALHSKGGLITIKLRDADTLQKDIEGLQRIAGIMKFWPGEPPISSADIDLDALKIHASSTQKSHLPEVARIIKQTEISGGSITVLLSKEIERLRHQLRLVKFYGTELPALVVRGPLSRFKNNQWQALNDAVRLPENTAEGMEDLANGNMRAGQHGVGVLEKKSRAVLRIDDINLRSGKGNDRKAAVILITPELGSAIEEIITQGTQKDGKVRKANFIGGKEAALTVEDGDDLRRVVTEHFIQKPAPLVQSPLHLGIMFKDLGHHAMIVRERVDKTAESLKVAEEESGAQDAVYIVVDTGKESKAIDLLTTLYLHNGLMGEKHYSGIIAEDSDTLGIAAQLQKACEDKYSEFIAKSRTFLGILNELKHKAKITAPEARDISNFLLLPELYLRDKSEMSWGEEDVLNEMVLEPIQTAIRKAGQGREDILSLCKDIRDDKPILPEDNRIQSFFRLLNTLPKDITGLCAPYFEKHSRRAMAEFSPIAVKLTYPKGSETIEMEGDPNTLTKKLKDALKSLSSESPLVLHCALSPEGRRYIESGIEEPSFFKMVTQSQLPGEGEKKIVNFKERGIFNEKRNAARALDNMARGAIAHSQAEIITALQGFFDPQGTMNRKENARVH